MCKSKIFVLALAFLAIASSCAHKSGQNRKERSHNNRIAQEQSAKPSQNLIAKKSSNRTKLDGAEIFRRYNSAVFMVYTTDGSNVYQGSGFFIGEEGLAVSNYHVFKGTGIGAEAIKMPNDDTTYKVSEIYQRSEDEDFIIFRVDYSNDNYIPITSKRPEIGQRIFAIGSPRGLENTFSSGEVSQWRGENLMQISALIDHGSSGGALINEYGEAVGITSGTFADGSQANLNYAWSINVVKPYVKCE